MSKVQLQGNVSGTGVFTIASPNSNTDRTLTLPDNTGTLLTSGSAIQRSQLPAGSVLQVVQATTTTMTTITSGNVNTDTALTASITPTSSSSRVLVFVSLPFILNSSGVSTYIGFGLKRNSTTIYTPPNDGSGSFIYGVGAAIQFDSVFNLQFLDSPASSSAVTYTVFANLYTTSGQQARIPYNVGGATATTAVITLMEIAA